MGKRLITSTGFVLLAAMALGRCGGASAPASNASAPAPNAAAPAPDASAPAAAAEAPAPPEPELREVVVPAGTVLPIELQSAVASDTSKVEDMVRARLRRAIVIDGVSVIPAGSALRGTVTEATQSGRVKGLARVAFRFDTLEPAGGDGRVAIRTAVIAREAQATKKKDAAKIGIPAAGGAVIGGLIGGGSGAATGAAIGGAAGTGVVLATRGQEVRFGPGADFSTKLLEPLTVRVPMKPTE
jgi:hypothetical protein